MILETDKQTIEDLNIFGVPGSNSIYTIFNHTNTYGGATILEEMFNCPFADEYLINNRSKVIQHFMKTGISFPFKNEWFDYAEQYLQKSDRRTRILREENTLARRFVNAIGADTSYQLISNGVGAVKRIIQILNRLLQSSEMASLYEISAKEMNEITSLIQNKELAPLLRDKENKKLSYNQVAEYDHIIRFLAIDSIKKVLKFIYALDVYISVAKVASEKGFVFPKAVSKGQKYLRIDGVVHPLVSDAIPNSISTSSRENVIFLTGANMAGKSTFMKALGVSVYLAHMGFPVSANDMEFSVLNGLYTTINLPDNLNLGYSHFYVEVLRVKKIAQQASMGKHLFIIFDELFRGTNVMDAFEATVAITDGFAKIPACTFLVSTHIVEAGAELKKKRNNIQYVYMPTYMDGNIPGYTYVLQQGTSSDKHGMIIINNEGIIELLNAGPAKS